jgi:hypothetical protein
MNVPANQLRPGGQGGSGTPGGPNSRRPNATDAS